MNHQRLIEVISNGPKNIAATPHQLLTAARVYAEQAQVSLVEAVSNELLRRYNKNLREEQRLNRKG